MNIVLNHFINSNCICYNYCNWILHPNKEPVNTHQTDGVHWLSVCLSPETYLLSLSRARLRIMCQSLSKVHKTRAGSRGGVWLTGTRGRPQLGLRGPGAEP